MAAQRSADDSLMSIYRQLIALALLLLLLGIIGIRYFNGLQQVADNSLQLEHNRLLNVLAMVRSQWLSQGKPSTLLADWQLSGVPQQDALLMDKGGWPLPATFDAAGCQQLWQQLLGASVAQAGITVSYQTDAQQCDYQSSSGPSIRYQLRNGRVIFLTAKAEQ
ncbi:MSHA biogenesis protein MshF [Shewanella dokdonensis]|uniref:MSHA biogenesis protein MshF n=1 Tax=Shewanella dokdonensis TaxID=712036 RepID=A0ABX8DDM9_9GAMM|nr:MSHA biogenesis protein MshF [Shewanella dokdonensis]MCL1075319.1 MSHA biogenesis protein MshF [Shewanella dokdonensis]QVK22032.1 MSHA biogenesis protein MshF [Shewanella dokdonensis]